MSAASSATIRAQIAEILGTEPDAIDPDRDLISQGLDSIRMMALAGRWRSQGLDVDFARLAIDPSVTAWAGVLSAAAPLQRPTADRGGRDDEPFVLAPMQHAMWIGRQDDQELGGVAAHLYVEFDGAAIDPERLMSAATQLAVRHPMLRAEFLPDGTQRIGDPPAAYPVNVNDLRGLDDKSCARRLAEIRNAKSHQQLAGRVLEITVTLLPGDRGRLHVDLDMQGADAMSYRTVMADLAALYRGQELAALGYTYHQYRQDVSEQPAPQDDPHQQWWSDRIADLPDPPVLPLVPAAQRTDARRTGRRWHWLDPQRSVALYEHCRHRGVTPAMALGASFADTIAGWSTDPRFLLNVPLFGRETLHPDIDRVVGDFTSSLILDVDLSDADTADQRARSLQQTFRAAAAHAAYPGLSVLRDLGRHRGTQVLAPVVFTSALGLGELFSDAVTAEFGAPTWIISQGPQVLLDAQVTEFDAGILVNWDVREDAFRPGVIDAMFARHIDEVLRLAAAGGAWDEPRSPLLPADQRAVRDVVNSVTATSSGQLLHDGFFANADSRPDAPAVFGSMGQLSYSQLRDRALAVAAALRESGLQAGDTVAVLGPKNSEQLWALLGILAAGCVYLPIGVDHPEERAARMLGLGAVRFALVCGQDLPVLPVPAMTVADAVRAGANADIADFVPHTGAPTQLAYVLFTSGSTGEPKGVELTHEAAMNTVEALISHFGIDRNDRCLALCPLECDLSVLEIFGTLATGGAIVVVDEEHRRDPHHWAALINRYDVSVLNFLPGWLHMLVDVAGPLPSLRVVATGGDWVKPQLALRLRELAPGLRFAGLGGATETAIHATICEVADPPRDWTAVPYGTPLPNNRCRVVGPLGDDCPDWVPGELWVAGRGIAVGYRARPALTAERFVEHDGQTWYRTGDLARYWPDGTCEFIGRADHRVKISGYRIETGEVEAALLRLSGVTGAVVLAVPNAGATADQLVALVSVSDAGHSAEDIRRQVMNDLSQHMVPRRIKLVDRIPFTVGGKIDRRAVERELKTETDSDGSYRPPSTALEAAIAGIFAGLLGLANVGVDDDFFACGGDSVLATTAVVRIRDWLDIPGVTVNDFFATRSVAAIGQRLTEREPDGRLEEIAEMYLEVAAMHSDDVRAAISGGGLQ